MIIFLDIEHPAALADRAYRSERSQSMERRRRLFQELSGQPCHICHYSDFQKADLDAPGISSLVTSGNRSLWDAYDLTRDFSEFGRALEETSKPVLGICGGHQLIGLLLGGACAPLRKLAPGEADLAPDYAAGYFKEWGFYQVEFVPDPLFAGFTGPITVNERHFWHLVKVPDSVRVIADNRACPVQAMRHVAKPIYGVQFHPELFDAAHPDGARMLENFFALSGAPVGGSLQTSV